MSHYVSSTTPLFSKGEHEAHAEKPFTWTSWPQQADFAEYISGSVYADVAGVLVVEECFDLPSPSEAAKYTVEEWAALGHWVPASWVEYVEVGAPGSSKQEARFKIAAKQSLSWTVFAGAPYWRLFFENTGANQAEFRVFARAFERGKV